jgi:hypothetical protein
LFVAVFFQLEIVFSEIADNRSLAGPDRGEHLHYTDISGKRLILLLSA